MKQLTCEMCGSTDLMKQDGVFVCQTCGCKYSVEEAKKMMVEGTVNVAGTVKVDSEKTIQNLEARIFQLLENKEFKKAQEYCEQLFLLDINNPQAHLASALIETECGPDILKSPEVSESVWSLKELVKSNHFLRAKKYANERTKQYVDFDDYVDDGCIFLLGKKTLIAVADTAEEVVIPNGVTIIGNDAFSGCKNLASVTIPDSVTTIRGSAFEGCESLTSVTIPNGVTTIGEQAFWGCESLTSVTIPDSVTTIGEQAFWGCESLTSVTIPDSVTTIRGSAFEGCKSLTSVTIPDSVTTIGEHTFSGCKSLASVTIPDSVTTIGKSAFLECESLTSVTIPNGVTTIDESTFSGCKNLASVAIPDSVTTISGSAFRGCESLTSVTIPNGVTTIGEQAFLWCKNLASVTIPDSVTTIGKGAFSGCKNLTSVTIPDSVTTIGKNAFVGCEKLTSVTIPNGVTTIGECTFSGCKNLTSVTIPDSVTTIGQEAFDGCENITNVTIPSKFAYQAQKFLFYMCKNVTFTYSDRTSSGGCYVATAVYGSYDCPQVWTLRRYRDYTLAETWYGRAFIRTYYAVSPTLVKWFGHTEWFKKMWKGKLDRMVANLNAAGVEDTPYEDKVW